ncbi:PAS/PAC sensor signal transduction histidine kinase [Melioribacter roseus P3M-2]|uniref:histidine kinase n=1 Tax=Melioribacter roseus (strain DSM 23840 / JCM 17771 / VKM B-2668 / P3M-2) TaxID=1191523 RepID=I6YXQ3_MELRP|nr:HAMP domain-containing sensor histidine kinase [Melioribacter roseus]AFN75347.1 PAS/PAC sensor signal transduction histidine kinase [Melioribacter roseus P3M-2]
MALNSKNIDNSHLQALFTLLNSFDVGYFVSDKSGNIIHTNSSLYNLLNIGFDSDVTSQTDRLFEYIKENLLSDLINIEPVEKLKLDFTRNFSAVLPVKGNRYIKMVTYPIRGLSQETRLWAFLDISEKVRGGLTLTGNLPVVEVEQSGTTKDVAEEENIQKLKVENRELREELNAKDKFISLIAHDLKSPFQGLLGIFDIISETFDELNPEELRRYLGYAKSSVKNLYNLVDELLNWSRLLLGQVKVNPVKVNLTEVYSNIIELNKHALNNKNLTVINYLSESLIAYADENMVQMVFRNLLSNAIKFSRRGGAIIINGRRTNGSIEVSVSDQGIGMDKETQDRLFKLGEQVNMLGTENEPGSGLGLLLCKEMVELNNGKIWFESEPDKGTTFYVSLPKAE